MSNLHPTPSFHSYNSGDMEGPEDPGDVVTPEQKPSGVAPSQQFLYVQVLTDIGSPLPPALFTIEVIKGVVRTQGMALASLELPLQVWKMNESEVALALGEAANLEELQASLLALQHWLGQKVQLAYRMASAEEVEQVTESEGSSPTVDQDARFLEIMGDLHKLAASPHGEALRIPTFSGTTPPGKNEATFAQWIYEVRDAQARFPEPTIRNWISRSLRGPPADVVRNLGPQATVKDILSKLETMHGAVVPFDLMMKKLFSLSQEKVETVTNYAIRLETTIASIHQDHPYQMTLAYMEASKRDRFFQGLKRNYRDSLRYLYDTGAPYESILRAARKTEAEVEHYKTPEAAMVKGAEGASAEVLKELAYIKSIATRAWTSSQQGSVKEEGTKPKSARGPCYGCGGAGHVIKECPNPLLKSLNSKGGSQKKQRRVTPPTPGTKRKSSLTQEEEPLLGDGQEQA